MIMFLPNVAADPTRGGDRTDPDLEPVADADLILINSHHVTHSYPATLGAGMRAAGEEMPDRYLEHENTLVPVVMVRGLGAPLVLPVHWSTFCKNMCGGL